MYVFQDLTSFFWVQTRASPSSGYDSKICQKAEFHIHISPFPKKWAADPDIKETFSKKEREKKKRSLRILNDDDWGILGGTEEEMKRMRNDRDETGEEQDPTRWGGLRGRLRRCLIDTQPQLYCQDPSPRPQKHGAARTRRQQTPTPVQTQRMTGGNTRSDVNTRRHIFYFCPVTAISESKAGVEFIRASISGAAGNRPAPTLGRINNRLREKIKEDAGL